MAFLTAHFWVEGGHVAAVAVAAAMKEEDPVHQISAVVAFVGEVVHFLVAQQVVQIVAVAEAVDDHPVKGQTVGHLLGDQTVAGEGMDDRLLGGQTVAAEGVNDHFLGGQTAVEGVDDRLLEDQTVVEGVDDHLLEGQIVAAEGVDDRLLAGQIVAEGVHDHFLEGANDHFLGGQTAVEGVDDRLLEGQTGDEGVDARFLEGQTGDEGLDDHLLEAVEGVDDGHIPCQNHVVADVVQLAPAWEEDRAAV